MLCEPEKKTTILYFLDKGVAVWLLGEKRAHALSGLHDILAPRCGSGASFCGFLLFFLFFLFCFIIHQEKG